MGMLTPAFPDRMCSSSNDRVRNHSESVNCELAAQVETCDPKHVSVGGDGLKYNDLTPMNNSNTVHRRHTEPLEGRPYHIGDPVEYFSPSHKRWLEAIVSAVNAEASALQLNIKPGCWLSEAEHIERVRLCSGISNGEFTPASLLQDTFFPRGEIMYATCRPETIDIGGRNIIFLDIDGVLHSLHGDDIFLDDCCSLLEEIVRATNAVLVLSSRWRTEPLQVRMINAMLHRRCLPLIHDCTKDLCERREVEICEWLDRHPEIGHWVAIDDMDLESATTKSAFRMRRHTVRTQAEVGLTPKDAERAISLLRGTCTFRTDDNLS